MLTAGTLKDRVRWLEARTELNALGEQESRWEPVAETWAQVRLNTGTRDEVSGNVVLTMGITVLARWRPELHGRMRLEYEGEMYAINSFKASRTDGSVEVAAYRIDT